MRHLFDELDATRRDVLRRADGDAEDVVVVLRRRYDAEIDDVWDAMTDPARSARWLGPVAGDLRVGGAFSSRATSAARSGSACPRRR
ncbi:SRPBCC domain-containing protein [Blastococcus sp. VKM Ac-2987]|uniref:SRPBCC domain-containing protein n=1 Tax=Blastococcus sp. VKM Ac-2987 TaxID=3004141 RepID=UPI0022ABBCEC|nr:SRPBCC domain-containing protein [Blastococcus sp. VKM Ac-2987]MCZ2858437.1 SRPBCC domain-containing protein [Blastococcus sp. VKM Ac-2987]